MPINNMIELKLRRIKKNSQNLLKICRNYDNPEFLKLKISKV